MQKDFTLEIYQAKNSVFTTREIALILNETNKDALKSKINYYIKKGVLQAVRRGIYVKPNYNKFELATKIYTPSYISLETVLQKESVIFQYYKTIFVVSYLSRCLEVKDQKIQFRKIKNEILLNPAGIIKTKTYSIASKERAFLDALYLYKDYHFDNLDVLDQKELFTIVPIYQSKALLQLLKKYFKNA